MTAIDTLAITLLAISLSFVPAVAAVCSLWAHISRPAMGCTEPRWMHVRADLHLWAASVVHSADMAVFSLSQQIKGGRFPGEKSLFTGVFAL